MPAGQSFAPYVRDVVSRYGKRFPDETERLSALRQFLQIEGADLRSRKNMTGHLTASALILDTTTRRLLLIHHRGLNLWLPPGGHLEDTETMRQAAVREVTEEVGKCDVQFPDVHVDPDLPIDIDTHEIPDAPRRGEGKHPHHDFCYVLTCKGTDWVTTDQNEVLSHRWLPLDDLPPIEMPSGLDRSAQKLRTAC